MSADDVFLYPEAGTFAEVANKLLSVADRPRDVRTDASGPVALALVVSQELYQRYLALDEAPSSPEEPKKRGPGRPRKDAVPESGITP